MDKMLFGKDEAKRVLEDVRVYAQHLVNTDPKAGPKGLTLLLFKPGLEIRPDWTRDELAVMVLASIKVGQPGENCYDIALDKAVMMYRTGLPSHVACMQFPEKLTKGSTVWAGAGMVGSCGASASGISGFNDLAASLAAASRFYTVHLSIALAAIKAGTGYV